MARPKKYPEKLVQRGIRLALESDRPFARTAADLGMHPEALRKRVRQSRFVGRPADGHQAVATEAQALRAVEVSRETRHSSAGAARDRTDRVARSIGRRLAFEGE
jgi:transposase-like protein